MLNIRGVVCFAVQRFGRERKKYCFREIPASNNQMEPESEPCSWRKLGGEWNWKRWKEEISCASCNRCLSFIWRLFSFRKSSHQLRASYKEGWSILLIKSKTFTSSHFLVVYQETYTRRITTCLASGFFLHCKTPFCSSTLVFYFFNIFRLSLKVGLS